MALNFPASPSLNDTHIHNGAVYVWDGTKWITSGQTVFARTTGETFTGNIEVGTGIDLNTDGSAYFSGNITTDGTVDGRDIAADGAVLDTATQPGDNVSTLVNDAGYLTAATSGVPTTTDDLTEGSTNLYSQWDDATGGINYAGGNVGIGTTSPSVLLHVSSSGDTIARVTSADGNSAFLDLGDASDPDGGRIVYDSGSNLTFSTTSSERLRIDSSGRVGIGTSSPNKPLHIYSGSSDSEIRLQTNSGTEQNSYITLRESSGDLDFYTVASGTNMKFHTVNAERMRIDSSGLVGIGESSPDQMLVIRKDSALTTSGTYPVIDLKNENASGYNQIRFVKASGYEVASILAYNGDNSLRFRTADANERMRIDNSGRVGIGDSSPGQKLVVKDTTSANTSAYVNVISGNTGNAGIIFGDSDADSVGGVLYSNNDNALRFFKSGFAEAARIDSSGNVGIGTSTTTSLGSGFKEVIVSGETEGAGLQLQDTDGNVKAGLFTSDVSNFAVMRTITNHPLVFRTNNTERMRVDEVGDVLIGTTSILTQTAELRVYSSGACAQELAGSSGTYTTYSSGPNSSSAVARGFVGTANQLAASGSVNDLAIRAQNELVFTSNGSTERMRILSGGGLTFNGDTAQANALDDYEEGTWTPVIKSGSNTISYSGGTNAFTYTKIGRKVTVSFSLSGATTSGSTGGYWTIQGLPFTSASGTRTLGTHVNYYGTGLIANQWPTFAHLDASSSTIDVYYKLSNTGNYDSATIGGVGANTYVFWQLTYFV